ncbi:diaminopimelate epimerase [Chryseolinea sp. T2]|uniref:diaminopimelate epimerase n=1 Tax=Chryseolinea sp. T2 TaxID=3129255 RepID=UPI0030774572
MKIHFYKYQATGNDFVVIDNRDGVVSLSADQISRICDRRFGVGADGVMLIENDPKLNFNLKYYNSDGSQSLCGNGSRAAVSFASRLGMINGKATFNAYDGGHIAELFPEGTVKFKLNDVKTVSQQGDDLFINTGSPHYIKFVSDVRNYPVVAEGRKIRYSEAYKPGGTNVNFVSLDADNTIFVRTYERGVEDETLSCGTGVTAAALAASLRGYSSPVRIKTLGGDLSVDFEKAPTSQPDTQSDSFKQIFLSGPAKMVFEGDLEL